MADTVQSFTEMLRAYSVRKAHLNEYVWKQCGGRVSGGVFAGMAIAAPPVWTEGDIAPMMLGCYEEELHPALGTFVDNRYDAIVNIGAADGYYAVGLARLFPQIPVIAFEGSEASHPRLAENARLNGVAERMVQRLWADAAGLAAVLADFPRALVVMDCEGCEAKLVPEALSSLARCDLLIECHHHVERDLAARLRKLLEPTHRVQTIEEGGRNPNLYACLRPASSLDRWVAVCENRPGTMEWLACWSSSAGRPE